MEANPENLLYFKWSFCSCLKEPCRNSINKQIGNIIEKPYSIPVLYKLHALVRGLKKSRKTLNLLRQILGCSFTEDTELYKPITLCILEILSKSDQAATIHLIHDLMANLDSSLELTRKLGDVEKSPENLPENFEVSYIRIVQHSTCVIESAGTRCEVPCCSKGILHGQEVVMCPVHVVKNYVRSVRTVKHFFQYISFMLVLLFEIKAALCLPEDYQIEKILRKFATLSKPPTQIVKVVTECFLIMARRKPATTFTAVYNDEVITKVDLYFHDRNFPPNSTLYHSLQLVTSSSLSEYPKKPLNLFRSTLLFPLREIIQYINEQYSNVDVELYFTGIKLLKRLLKGHSDSDPEGLGNCINTYVQLLSILVECFSFLPRELQKTYLKRVKYISTFVFRKRSSNALPSFVFYRKIVDLVHLNHPLVVPVYYSILYPYLSALIKKAPTLVSMIRQAELLKFASGSLGSPHKKMKYGSECGTPQQVLEFAREVSKELSPYYHYTYEDAVAMLLDLLAQANSGNKSAIALSVLLLYPYDGVVDKLFVENLIDPRESFINTNQMVLKCAKILFRNTSVNNALSNKGTASLISLLKVENKLPTVESMFVSRICEGLLLYDIPEKLLEVQSLREAIESFVQGLWRKDDRLSRFVAYSGALYGMMSRYLEFIAGASIGGCLTILVDRIGKLAKEKNAPELFINYVDTICFLLMHIICKLHKTHNKLSKSGNSLSFEKPRGKAVQAIFTQRYCNFCLEEQRQSSLKPKHAVKCHKCKERNLALLLPVFTPCPICFGSKLFSNATIHTLNQSPLNGLKCASIKTDSERVEQALDTIMVNIVTELCEFIEIKGHVMTSGEYPCYEIASNVEFNNHVYGYSKMLEVVKLFLKHSQSLTRKQVLRSMIVKINKRAKDFSDYFHEIKLAAQALYNASALVEFKVHKN